MKAVVIRSYGSPNVLRLEEVEQPKINPDQVLLRVRASSVNPIDWKIRRGVLSLLTGSRFPVPLGFDLAGEVMAVGSQVTQFQPGDTVYGMANFPGGAYAEYITAPESFIAFMPSNMTYEEAATVPLAALTALQALRDLGEIHAHQSVLVNGAAGGVGIFATQIAKALGTKVTGVCSGKNLHLVKSLGAEVVIDYQERDFTCGSEQYDIIFDAVGKRSLWQCQRVLKPNGIYISTLPLPEVIFQSIFTALLPGQKAKIVLTRPNSQDLNYLRELIESNKIATFIARTYTLHELTEAHTYSETEHAAGKIAITI